MMKRMLGEFIALLRGGKRNDGRNRPAKNAPGREKSGGLRGVRVLSVEPFHRFRPLRERTFRFN